ncbi:MAG: hypothetical protein IIZ86_02985 [Firmicutes bacterium]|nr:hypothetical protein [Bacillota bacterium]
MNPESKYTVKKTFSAETVVFPVIFLAFFAYLTHVMGMANMINTIMKTAFDLLINTVLYIVAVCVIMGAVSELLTEFGFVALMDRVLRPLMRPVFGLPGAASLGIVTTFLSDNPAILALTANPRYKYYFKAYQFPALTNIGTSFGMGLIVCTYMLSLASITGESYGKAVVVGLAGATIGAVVSTRIMLHFTKKVYGTDLPAQDAFPSAQDTEIGELEPGLRPVRKGNLGNRVLGALLDGGASGLTLGAGIVPGVLIICTLVMILMNGPSDSGLYTGAAYEGVGLIPAVAAKLNFILEPLFGFSNTQAIGVPVTALGAAGAAISLASGLASRGLLAAGDVAVFTAMCMCWSGYLSTHTSMMDSLHCKELTGKALISHTIGGIAAGFAAHWIFILVNLL